MLGVNKLTLEELPRLARTLPSTSPAIAIRWQIPDSFSSEHADGGGGRD